jgi:hypothetical protein
MKIKFLDTPKYDKHTQLLFKEVYNEKVAFYFDVPLSVNTNYIESFFEDIREMGINNEGYLILTDEFIQSSKIEDIAVGKFLSFELNKDTLSIIFGLYDNENTRLFKCISEFKNLDLQIDKVYNKKYIKIIESV